MSEPTDPTPPSLAKPAASPAAPAGTKERHLALLGGWRRRADGTAPSSALIVAAVGGANLDLSDAVFPAGGTTLTKVAVVGGIDVTVPAGTNVELSGFSLFGGRRIQVTGEPGGPVLRIRAFAFVGGVHVHTA